MHFRLVSGYSHVKVQSPKSAYTHTCTCNCFVLHHIYVCVCVLYIVKDKTVVAPKESSE